MSGADKAAAGAPAVSDARALAAAGIGVAALVLAVKALAWWLTGSAAIYSDALESVVNVAAAVMAFAALRYAARPADANHPYGHDKAEFFAAAIEGALIVIAAASILEHAWEDWRAPRPIDEPWRGLALVGAATLVNAAWAALLVRRGRASRSPALAADGRHLFSDVVTSAAIVLGVGIAAGTGRLWLDPALAAAVALYVLWTGVRLIRASIGSLMDEAPPAGIVERIRALVGEHAAGAIEAHDLRTRYAARFTYLEFHLVVPGAMRVAEAHAICDRIEAALRREIEGLIVTIHVEPEGKAKHAGVLVL